MAHFLRPYFRGGKLVRPGAITILQSQEMQQAASWTPVSSSNVKGICWRPNTGKGEPHGLGVWFLSGGVYWYDVPFDTYKAMLASGSKGQFVNENLKSLPFDGPHRPG
jgi:hypothetical protein